MVLGRWLVLQSQSSLELCGNCKWVQGQSMCGCREAEVVGRRLWSLQRSFPSALVVFIKDTRLSAAGTRQTSAILRYLFEAGSLTKTCHQSGYIDLSKRRVSAEEVVKCEEQYEKGRAVDSIMVQVAKKRGVSTESLYESVAWPLHKQYGHSFEAFKLSIRCVHSKLVSDLRYGCAD